MESTKYKEENSTKDYLLYVMNDYLRQLSNEKDNYSVEIFKDLQMNMREVFKKRNRES